jgi:hypothetical protein
MTRLLACVLVITFASCGDGTEADQLGVGAQCTSTDECNPEIQATCLTQFKGGYCGLTGCTGDADCPEASACIRHTDGVNYCFRVCADKAECNVNRDVENESNCSGSVEFVDPDLGRKACVPPSGT